MKDFDIEEYWVFFFQDVDEGESIPHENWTRFFDFWLRIFDITESAKQRDFWLEHKKDIEEEFYNYCSFQE